jgi:hypothetical protein
MVVKPCNDGPGRFFSHRSDDISVAHGVSRGFKSKEEMRAPEEGDIFFTPHLHYTEFMPLLRSSIDSLVTDPHGSRRGLLICRPAGALLSCTCLVSAISHAHACRTQIVE